MQRIVRGVPPNVDAIAKVFPQARKLGTIFAWGDTVYVNDTTADLSPQLRAHEAVHCQRQLEIGIEVWWDRYLTDREFMFQEELIAHRAEYGAIKGLEKDRNRLSAHLNTIAGRLASPLYGNVVTLSEAKQLILNKRMKRPK